MHIRVIQPRLRDLYDWSADELAMPGLRSLLSDGIASYAWGLGDAGVWQFDESWLARVARRVLPARR
jgi:hypothetical protein